MTERDEARALGRLAFEELGQATGGVQAVHRAVAARAFGLLGAPAAPVRRVHDAIADGVYGAVRAGTSLAGRGAEGALRTGGPPSLSTTRRGSVVLGLVQGLLGDALEREGSELHAPMSIRLQDAVVAPSAASLAAAFPHATPRLVVLVHGLMETEHAWDRGAYGRRLGQDLGFTPLAIRFNSGRHVSENGRSLAYLLEQVVAAWPVEVESIALVGHSMGGLVARSACHAGDARGNLWVRRVGHVVSLAAPHAGAPLEQAVHRAAAALDTLPETRPFAGLLRRRSAGIRDLRHGSLVDGDWQDRDPDAPGEVARANVPLLPGVLHGFISASLTRSPAHPLGRLVGDWLVLAPSAAIRGSLGLEAHVGGTTHLGLLDHPEVYAHLREWLAQ